jgi:hypothetical protein
MHDLDKQLHLVEVLINKVGETPFDEDWVTLNLDEEDYAVLSSIKETINLAIYGSDSNKQNTEVGKFPRGFFDNPLALTQSDLGGLPEDLVEQLSDLDELEGEILKLMDLAGGTLILDKIIAGLFHMTGKSHQRNQLTAKLYRMTKKGLVWSVPKKKGVYTINKDEFEL